MASYSHEKFVCSENVDINKYFTEFSELVSSEIKKSDGKSLMGIDLDEDEFKYLENICSPDHLTDCAEIPIEKESDNICMAMSVPLNYEIPDYISGLEILLCKKKWENKQPNVVGFPMISKKELKEDVDLVANKDIAVIVKVYFPFSHPSKRTDISHLRIKCSHYITILANQTLADLRDKILCVQDIGFCIEIENPDDVPKKNIKETYPSNFIFIENCFYNDMRNANSVDYSKVIRDWAESKNLTKFSTGVLEDTRISDLNFRVGYPYVYQHQGDCEHILIFSEIRLLSQNDLLSSSNYPYFSVERKVQSTLCYICGNHLARFLVSDSDRLPHKYNYFCKTCLLSYNYVDGKKLGKFKLYPYYSKTLLDDKINVQESLYDHVDNDL